MILLLLGQPALAFECLKNPFNGCAQDCQWLLGNSATYHIIPDDAGDPNVIFDMETWQVDEVEAAAGNWRVGAGQRLTGGNGSSFGVPITPRLTPATPITLW